MLKPIINILFIFIILPLSIGLASDRPENVMLKADHAIKRALQIDDDILFSASEPLLVLTEQESLMDWVKRELPRIKVYNRETLLKEQKEFNLNLFNSFNAGISLLSDYLYQATTDKDLNWTKENSYFINEATDERVDIDASLVDLISRDDSASTATFKVTSFFQIYEIERQKSCLKFTYYLDLLKYWKSKIFPTGTPFSYLGKNAAAIKGQVSYIIDSWASYNDSYAERAERFGKVASSSLIEVCQKIKDAIPDIVTTPVSMAQLKGRNPRAVATKAHHTFQQKMTEAKNDITKKTETFVVEFAPFLRTFFTLSENLKQLQSIGHNADLKARKTKRRLQADYQEFQALRRQIGIRTKEINSPLDFTHLNSPVEYITLDLSTLGSPEAIFPDVKKASQSLPQNMPADAQAKKKLKEKEKEEDSEKTDQDSLSSDRESNEPLYDDAYWRAEHHRHQRHKKELLMKSKANTLSDYEVSLYTYLQERIFKTLHRPKVEELKHDLRKLYLDVKPNGTGNGSTYHVSPMSHNPLFSTDLEYATAYFNVHLPSENIPLPYNYFRYLQSGFSNVFGLTSEYINEQLENMQTHQGIGESSI